MRKTVAWLSLLAALAGVRVAAACDGAAIVAPRYVQAVTAPSYLAPGYSAQAFVVSDHAACIVEAGDALVAGYGGSVSRVVVERRGFLVRRRIVARP
jgi:hypothetical protein